jgi:hypothetical protein
MLALRNRTGELKMKTDSIEDGLVAMQEIARDAYKAADSQNKEKLKELGELLYTFGKEAALITVDLILRGQQMIVCEAETTEKIEGVCAQIWEVWTPLWDKQSADEILSRNGIDSSPSSMN